MSDCLFCDIIQRKRPTPFVYQDELCVAFDDINPKAKHHLLIIPRQHIATLNDITHSDQNLMGHLIQIAQHLAFERQMAQSGYRLVMNCHRDGGQEIYHLHWHLLGGQLLQSFH